ncbi:MAG: XdhC family protein [Bacteroidota bacterium]
MNVWNFILTQLNENRRVILLVVIENLGSSPGRLGFKMAVAENSEMFGSIGGGIMEYEMVEYAKTLFTKSDFKPFIKKQVHNTESDKDQSGMICSGEQTILFYPIEPLKVNVTLLSNVLSCIESNCKSVFSFMPQGMNLAPNYKIENQFYSKISAGNKWEYHEKISFTNELYIVGAGHVSLALSRTMQQLGFYVTVFDNRHALNTMEQNSYAHKKQVVDYYEIEKHIPKGQNIYVIIMTNQHVSDKDVLSSLIRNEYKYIGLMGSKKKVQKLFAELKTEGYSDEELKKVHSPIGISIKSETPEEIAISIAAEIIMVKNKK